MFSSRRFTPDLIAITVALIVLIGAIALSLFRQIDPLTRADGSTLNNGRSGAQTLYNWLNDLGYNAQPTITDELQPNSQDRILFILAPNLEFSQWEQQNLERWIQAGGTLIWVQDRNHPGDLLRLFHVRMRWQWLTMQQATLTLPTLNWPLVGNVDLRASRRIEIDCGQAAVHLGDCDSPVLVSFGYGQGQVYLMSTLFPFTNDGLRNGRNAQLVRNLVQLNAAPGSRILFDEIHHQAVSFWLVQTPAGWATILLVLLLAAYGAQSNQRFGNARPSLAHDEPVRRDTAAFITQMATAQKELDPGLRVRHHYWQRLKRKLGKRYSTDPQLPDELFFAELSPYLAEQIMAQLVYLTVQLDRQDVKELDLQQWTNSVIMLWDRLDQS